jgi:hypothetical protein
MKYLFLRSLTLISVAVITLGLKNYIQPVKECLKTENAAKNKNYTVFSTFI